MCSKHFKKDCFLTDTVLPRLTPIAVPTIMGEDRATDLPNNLIIPNAVNYEDMLDNLNGKFAQIHFLVIFIKKNICCRNNYKKGSFG